MKKIKSKELNKPISFRIRLRLIINKKNEKEIFENIKKIYGGSVKKRDNMYIYTLDSNFRQLKIINYINTHPLKSNKYRDYLKFKNIFYELKLKKHLNIKNIKTVIHFLSKNK